MDDHEAAEACVVVAMQQFNDRLLAVADGAGGESVEDQFGARAVALDESKLNVRALLASGLDIELDALDGLTHDMAHALMDDVKAEVRATGHLGCGTIQRALDSMFVTGCLHERERARREAGA